MAGSGARKSLVNEERLHYLIPDSHVRVERTHRVLKNHRNLVAANAPDLVVVHLLLVPPPPLLGQDFAVFNYQAAGGFNNFELVF